MNRPMDDDAELLRDYAATRSERAFARLVERHIDLVYSTALRRMSGDPHRAAEVTQMVFIDLARKAATLARHPVLTGWLHQSTRWAANNLRRAEQRRLTHERAAAAELLAAEDTAAMQAIEWEALRPLLDEALDELRDADREAVLLRFFDNCTFAEVGRQLGTGENAARMRVERALEKLHGILRRKGLAGGVVALGASMAKNAVAAAPADLAATVTPTAVAAGAAATGAVVGGAATILMSKLTVALIGACVVTLAVLCLQQREALATERDALVRGREQHAVRQAEVARIATQVERLQTDLARLPSAAELPPPDPVEMERKRLDLVIRKGELDSHYAPLLRRLKLTREQADALKVLVVERNQAGYDAAQLLKAEGVDFQSAAERREFGREATAAMDRRIANLLGTEKFAEFTDYDRPYGIFGALPVMNGEPADETAWDRGKLLAALYDETCAAAEEESFARNDGLIVVSDVFLERARAIMTEKEYRGLLSENEAVRDRRRMDEIARTAAYAGKLKLSKGSQRDYALSRPAASTAPKP